MQITLKTRKAEEKKSKTFVDNQIGTEGARELSDALNINSALTRLDLSRLRNAFCNISFPLNLMADP